MLVSLYQISLLHYALLASAIFAIGMSGILLGRKSIIHFLMSIELMLLGININFIAFSSFLSDILGQMCAIFILTAAASEAAIGLAIIVLYYRQKGRIDINYMNNLRG